jgi:hypothetical protein
MRPGGARRHHRPLRRVKALFVCSANADHLTDAVEALEQLARPGGDLHIFLKVLQLGAVRCRPPHNCYRPGARPPHRRHCGSESQNRFGPHLQSRVSPVPITQWSSCLNSPSLDSIPFVLVPNPIVSSSRRIEPAQWHHRPALPRAELERKSLAGEGRG